MNLSNGIVNICNKCNNFTFSCQCICPYCGDIIETGCNCSKKTLGSKNTQTEFMFDFQNDSTKRSGMQYMIKEYDDWKRLEKWQFGRRNFS